METKTKRSVNPLRIDPLNRAKINQLIGARKMLNCFLTTLQCPPEEFCDRVERARCTLEEIERDLRAHYIEEIKIGSY